MGQSEKTIFDKAVKDLRSAMGKNLNGAWKISI